MTTCVSIHEAKTHLSRLLHEAMAGEEVIIAKSGIPVARLVPIVERKEKRELGTEQGKIWLADDFDAPLPEDILRLFEGG